LRTLDRPPQADGAEKPGGSRSPHAIYNLGNSRSEELDRLVALIEQATGRKAVIEHTELQPGEVVDTYADTSVTARDTGFGARTSLDQGVPEFVRWFRQHYGR
jgi:UDP-glucuronate 4-epimerase